MELLFCGLVFFWRSALVVVDFGGCAGLSTLRVTGAGRFKGNASFVGWISLRIHQLAIADIDNSPLISPTTVKVYFCLQ